MLETTPGGPAGPGCGLLHPGTDLLCLMCVRYLFVLGSSVIIKPLNVLSRFYPPIPYAWLAMHGRFAGLGFAFKL